MKKLLTFLFFSVLSLWIVSAECKLEKKDSTQSDFYNYWIQTESFEKSKNYSGAIACLEELWKIDPSHINVWFKMWINYANIWEYGKALEFYKKLDEFWPLSEDKKLAVKHFVEEAEKMIKLENGVKEKNKELEAKQAELEKKQKELEMKAEAIEAKARFTPEAEFAKSALGAKASIIEGLVPVIKSKDSETQQKVSLILETFKASSDEYTRNIGIYLSYLLE